MNYLKKKSIKLITLVVIITTLLAVIAVTQGLYWVFTGNKALEATNHPFPVAPKIVKPEQTIILDASFCKYTDAEGRVLRRLVSDKTEISAPVVYDSSKKGCQEHVQIPVVVPPQTPPGKYHINYRVVYKTNPLHTVTVELNSQEFTVQ